MLAAPNGREELNLPLAISMNERLIVDAAHFKAAVPLSANFSRTNPLFECPLQIENGGKLAGTDRMIHPSEAIADGGQIG